MRPLSDLAERLRARLWARGVYVSDPKLSWDDLDEMFTFLTQKTKRQRVFHRIYREGHTPLSIVKGNQRVSLVQLVDERFPGTAGTYDSKFWELVKPPGPSIEEVRRLNAEMLRNLGWYQMSKTQSAIGRRFFPERNEFKAGDQQLIQRGARIIAKLRGFDALGVLVAQFRLALHDLSLPAADTYLRVLRDAIRGLDRDWFMDSGLIHDLRILVEKRIFRNDWSPIDPNAWSRPPRQRKRADQIPLRARLRNFRNDPTLMMEILESDSRYVFADAPQTTPLLPPGRWISWFLDNFTSYEVESKRQTLEKMLKDMTLLTARQREATRREYRAKLPKTRHIRYLKPPAEA